MLMAVRCTLDQLVHEALHASLLFENVALSAARSSMQQLPLIKRYACYLDKLLWHRVGIAFACPVHEFL